MSDPEMDGHRWYRAPEMAGPPVVVRPMRAPTDDDVTKQPGTMAALFPAVALLMSGAFLVVGLYGPSKIVDTRTLALSTDPAP